MKIVHRVSFASSPEVAEDLGQAGFDVAASGFVAFDADEDDPRWPALAARLKRHGAVDMVSTRFTKGEVRRAEVLELMTGWHHGYPQPERDMAYKSLTYDDSDYCQDCGGGLRQVAPFRMSREPRWGRRGILQLNWVFGEFFARPEVHEAVFAPHGIAARPVLDKRGERALETVVQLDVPDEVPVDTTDLVGEMCPTCDRVRYLPHVRGPFPAPLEPLPAAMVGTVERFGSGFASHRRILVTAALWADLDAAGRLGVSPRPAGKLD